MKTLSYSIALGLLLLAQTALAAEAFQLRGEWKCTALTPQTLALAGDYSGLQLELFRKRFAARSRSTGSKRLPGWKKEANFHLSGTEAIAEYRPKLVRLLADRPQVTLVSSSGKPVKAVRTGSWLSPAGQARFPDENGKEKISQNADAMHFLFLQLDRPLADGEKLTVTLPTGEQTEFTYRAETPVPLFKINQVGYLPAARKYAYLGGWLGTAGPLPLFALDGTKFQLRDAENGQPVFSGVLRKRPDDPVNASGNPFTGEEVLELDFSEVSKPGRYYLSVDGIGRSETFRIGTDTMAECFFIHARGLYHQRCGIARTKPYTNWTAPACHTHCFRGNFPPDDRHYNRLDKRPYGFTTADGKSLTVNHFLLIKQNPPRPEVKLAVGGGWHDAGDWDRRPQHMGIVGDLAAVYLLKPENFCDGQLNLPESGNGIPDILDEALWGLEHLRLRQQADGGVGTWVETTRHPTPLDGGSWEDALPYYVSCATRNSSLEYAAYASELALALRKAGAAEKAEQYRLSAEKAWAFAQRKNTRKIRTYHYNGRLIFYREESELAPELVVKAGLNLHLLGGGMSYLTAAEDAAKAAQDSMKKNDWRWSPLFWTELEFCRYESAVLDKLREARRKRLLSEAETLLRQQENNYPVRIAWYGPKDGWVHTMGWGTYHPMRRARTLIIAHAMTSDKAFWDAACLANDFHNGANPSGSSMTSGLGKVYPVRFLDLNSYADGIAEFVPGITPYRNTYGIPREAVRMAYGLYYKKQPQHAFPGLSLSLLPESGLKEDDCVKALSRCLPIWHRWCNVEGKTVAASEYTVWETISPAAAVTGYLLDKARKPAPEWLDRKPVSDLKMLPGYYVLP
ncbi:MAG: glycoside hydrolase family 9 protein [Lentisphaeria bacterium]|nr:glycoside hydrolase family 9 protein [Lentisphaeria bacterium]